ncbi:shikimate kinase [Candidatus Poribacteria bacterium]|nr:MAG: shikimate kinase [Candidatus Poribacteria bacterium]
MGWGKSVRNIVLVGFMGTGKTSVGKRLAQRLEMPLIDTDDIIAADSGMDIPDIFAQHGEAYFRDLESAAVCKAANLEGHVVSTGGGVVLRASNLDMLKRTGVVFCLTATSEEIWQRVGSETHRPLLQTPNPLGKIEQMLIERRPSYARADHQIPTTGLSIKVVTDKIVEIFQQSLYSE